MNNRHFQTSQAYDLTRFYYRGFCQVTRSAALAIAHSAYTTIAFDVTNYDLNRPNETPMHDNAVNNDRVYIRLAGVYLITANVVWAGNKTGFRLLYLARNGANIALDRLLPLDGADTSQQITTQRKLSVGDYITAYVHQTSGGNLNIQQGAYSPLLSLALIGD